MLIYSKMSDIFFTAYFWLALRAQKHGTGTNLGLSLINTMETIKWILQKH